MSYAARLGTRKTLSIVIPSLLAVAMASAWAASTVSPTRAVRSADLPLKADSTLRTVEELRAGLTGTYRVSGTDPNGKPYPALGIVDISLAPSGALEITWDSGRSVGVGQVMGSSLAVSAITSGRTAVLIMNIEPNGSLSGRVFRRTDRGSKGTEVWKKI
jgi:hypothetical protein